MIINVLHIGLGPVGAAVVRQVARRKGMKIVGAVDVDPAKAGRDLGDVCGMRRKLGVTVLDDITKAIKALKPDIAVLCTDPSLKKVLPQIEQILKLKVAIISTTAELAYPVKAHRAIAKKIDALARRSRVAVLGTGVNPGFAMDALPIALTALCAKVDAIEVRRVEPAPRRELHAGLAESITMIADAMNWKLDRITDEVTPKMVDDVTVGITQVGVGYVKGKPLIRLHTESWVGSPEPSDTVHIVGTPPISSTVTGAHSDIAAAAMVVNAIPKVLTAPPGLRTMKDMVLPGFFGG